MQRIVATQSFYVNGSLRECKSSNSKLKKILIISINFTYHVLVIHPMGCEVKMVIDPSNKVVADVPKASLSVHFSSLITEVLFSKESKLDSLVRLSDTLFLE